MTIQDFQDRLCGYRPTLQQARAEFAVLVPLIERPDGLHLLYEVRAQNLRHHAAEVCFPGGRMEPGETPVQCALRETWEELAIAPEDVTVLGELDFLYLRSECLMHPVLARVDAAALGHMRRRDRELPLCRGGRPGGLPLAVRADGGARLPRSAAPALGADCTHHRLARPALLRGAYAVIVSASPAANSRAA